MLDSSVLVGVLRALGIRSGSISSSRPDTIDAARARSSMANGLSKVCREDLRAHLPHVAGMGYSFGQGSSVRSLRAAVCE